MLRTTHLLLTFVTLLASSALPAQTPSLTLSGSITGASGQHAVYVALWDANTFLQKPVKQLRLDPQATASYRFQISPGRWAVSAYEDLNDNGKLDMGHFGPKEPSGFWRPFNKWRKPRFDDVSAQLDRDTPDADIKLRK